MTEDELPPIVAVAPAPARGWVRSVSAPLARPNLQGMMPGSNPYLFVVGAARSGTTPLQRMLDAHPLLAVVNETYWLSRNPFDAAMQNYHAGRTRPKPGRAARRCSRTSTRFARCSPRTFALTTGPFRGAGDMTLRDTRTWPWRAK
jgi:hypothetical protein